MSPPRKYIDDARCPAVRGLPDDIYHILHHSFVGILRMRRNIEKDETLINASIAAIFESIDLLKRTQDELNSPLHVVQELPGTRPMRNKAGAVRGADTSLRPPRRGREISTGCHKNG
jgi:hypothetical protein